MGFFLLVFLSLLILLVLLDTLSARRLEEVSSERALLLSLLWLVFSLAWGGFLWKTRGSGAALDFAAVYGIEYLLSIDNLFVFYSTFRLFGIRGRVQSRLLTLGVLLAVLLRALLIWGGLSLVRKYEALFPLFGFLLLAAAIRLSRKPRLEAALPKTEQPTVPASPDAGWAWRWLLRRKDRVQRPAQWMALLSIELADLLFALDSVPASFAITLDPAVVFPANLCAVMGLRSLYPLVERAAERWKWLAGAIPWILALMGVELCAKPLLSIPTAYTLALVALLFAGAFLSARRKGGSGNG